MWDNDNERVFLRIMHEMLGTLMWREVQALQRGGSRRIGDRIDDLLERIRRDVTNAKTRPMVRDALTRWITKGGSHETIREQKWVFWKMVDDPHEWEKARDLARLALVTYEPKGVAVSTEPDLDLVPEDLAKKLFFDDRGEYGRLRFVGKMSETERDLLRGLFATAEDHAAIDELFRKSQED